MSLRTSFQKLIGRDLAAPTLRERAAALRAGIRDASSSRNDGVVVASMQLPRSAPGGENDVDLIRLGRQFEASRVREVTACEACNAAQRKADRNMPLRPACLTFRATDHSLGVYRRLTYADALEGLQIEDADIAFLRGRMPMRHEVLRLVRPGERSHVDHPGRKYDIVPHPEAQARAEEIITAWDAWRAEQGKILDQHVTVEMEAEAEAASEAAAALAEQIASLPAHTVAGFRVKLRALAHYNATFIRASLPDRPDPDQRLAHSLWQDVQQEGAPIADPTDWSNPPPGFMAHPAISPQGFLNVRDGIRLELMRLRGIARADLARRTADLTTPDDTQRMRRELRLDALEAALTNEEYRPELVIGFGADSHIAETATAFCQAYTANAVADRAMMAGKLTEEQWRPCYDAVVKLMEQLEAAEPATILGMALKCLGPIGAAAWDVPNDPMPSEMEHWHRAGMQFEGFMLKSSLVPLPSPQPGSSTLLDRDLSKEAFDYAWGLDLTPVPSGNLMRLYDLFAQTADVLSDATEEDQFWAQPRRGYHTAGGMVIDGEQNRLACLRDACALELQRRKPKNDFDRDAALIIRIRHEMLCEMKIRDRVLLAEINKAWGG